MQKFLLSFSIVLLLWVALAGFTVSELLLGIVVASLIALLVTNHTKVGSLNHNPFVVLIKFTFIYVPFFIYKLVQANFQMSKTVLSPSVQINPGFVRIKIKLNGDISKFTLANSITLTPGTIALDIKDNELYVHSVNLTGKNENEHYDNIAGDFEKVLGGIFA